MKPSSDELGFCVIYFKLPNSLHILGDSCGFRQKISLALSKRYILIINFF